MDLLLRAVVRTEPATGLGPNQAVPRCSALLRAYPNPFRDAVFVNLDVGLTRKARLTVLDALGRRVRDLGNVAGRGVLVWDGRDDNGRAVPAGVYLFRLKLGRNVAVSRLTRR